jgi:hypothetical protein
MVPAYTAACAGAVAKLGIRDYYSRGSRCSTSLGHSDARTTDLYNRTEKEVTRNIVERISI